MHTTRRHHTIAGALVAALVAVGSVGTTAMASPPVTPEDTGIVGTGHGVAAVALTVVAADPDLAYVNICARHSWCGISGSLWATIELKLDCSVVVGRTWYGGAWVWLGGQAGVEWWTFKVVDGGLGEPDRMGMNRPSAGGVPSSPRYGAPACGARRLATSPVIAGDFSIVGVPR